MKRLAVGVLSILLLSIGAMAQTLTQVKPQINHWGGAVGAVAMSRDRELLIGTNGGMYRSITAGRTWTFLDSFPPIGVNFISFLPRDPNTILATTSFDTQTVRRGGIWRSTDGGVTWDNPSESIPPMTARCPDRVSARGISWAPNSDIVWVATDCGLMRSEDSGAHWTQIIADPAASGGAGRPDRMSAVLAIDRQHVIAGGDTGYFYINDGRTWHRSAGELGNDNCPRGLAVAPGNARLIFRADFASGTLRYSENQGVTWANFPGDGLAPGNTGPFILTTASARGTGWFELYYGTGTWLKRITLSTNPAVWRSAGATWDVPDPSLDHADPHDLAFDPVTKRPVLLGADSGVMNTADGGRSWQSVGGGPDGLNALVVTGVAAQRFNTIAYDLNFVTWDNWAWSSRDSGLNWRTIPDIAEGSNIRGSGPQLASPKDALIALQPYGRTATLRGRGGEYLSEPFRPPLAESCYRHITFFNSPSDGRPQVLNASYGCDGANVIYHTRPVTGGEWRQILSDSSYAMHGYPKTATTPTAAVLVAAYNNGGRILLTKAVGIEQDTRPVSLTTLPMENFGSIAVMPWNGREPVFAVKPDDDSVLIASDATAQRIKRSVSGGRHWDEIDLLTQLVTDNGLLHFDIEDNTQATVIAFDPDSPNRVLIGTMESGLLYSTNAGASWERIPRSNRVRRVTSIGFDGYGVAFIGTAGSGIWRWGFEEGFDLSHAPLAYLTTLSLFLDPATGERSHEIPVLVNPNPNPEPYPLGVIVARRGYINDAIFDKQGGLTLYVSDTAALAAYNPEQMQLPFTVVVSKEDGFKNCGACADAFKKGNRVRAILFEKDRIKALGFGDETPISDKILFADQSPAIYHPKLTLAGVIDAPGSAIARQGAKITVRGAGFAPSVKGAKPATVSIYLNGQRVADVEPDEKGGFEISLELRTRPGQGAVTCTQETNSGRLRIERALLVQSLDGQKQ